MKARRLSCILIRSQGAERTRMIRRPKLRLPLTCSAPLRSPLSHEPFGDCSRSQSHSGS
jgi:hypothetical protein